jgi:type II secretory pathway component GspD/PulD (secretin)
MINLRAEIYALPKLEALQLVERFDNRVNTDEAVQAVRELVAQKKARLVESPSIVTRNGQRAKVGSGKEYKYVHDYVGRKGEDYALRKSIFFGMVFEVDPMVAADGRTLEINMAVEKTFGEPVIGRATVKAPVSGKEMAVETVQIDQGTIQTAITMMSGQTRLVGTLSPTQAESDETLVVFVKAWVSAVGRKVDPE